MAKSPSQQLTLRFRPWGGTRPGAGRKPQRRAGAVPHVTRAKHRARHPAHVTLRLGPGLPSLRSQVIGRLVRRAFKDTWRRWFRVVHFSIQTNHVHLIVEADNGKALSRGLSALAIRIARRLNALLRRRGAVFPERYHAHELKTPREVRNALVYVLQNGHKHNVVQNGLDPYSSGAMFDGWRDAVAQGRAPPSHTGPEGGRQAGEPIGANRATTWLLATGWRMHGLIGSWERPGGS